MASCLNDAAPLQSKNGFAEQLVLETKMLPQKKWNSIFKSLYLRLKDQKDSSGLERIVLERTIKIVDANCC
jgi:hypothetical protein